MRTTLLALALFVVGCGYREEVVYTELDATMGQLWAEVFHGDGPPPPVTWVEGADLNCGGGWGWMFDGQCVDGVTWGDGPHTWVARRPADPLWTWSLSHEFAHVLSFLRGGDGDLEHSGAAFQPGGLVEMGERWLADYEAARR